MARFTHGMLPVLATMMAALPMSGVATAQNSPSAAAASDAQQLATIVGQIVAEAQRTSFSAQLRAGLRVDRFTDYSLAAAQEADRVRDRHLAALRAVDPGKLDDTQRTTLEILRFQLSNEREEPVYWLTFDLTAYAAPMTFIAAQQVLASHRFANADDARHYVHLVSAYAAMLESLTAKTVQQARRGLYLPRPALPVVRSTWQGLAGKTAALRPDPSRLSALPGPARAALAADLDRVLAQQVDPGFAKLLATIGRAYESNAPEKVGLGQYPGGDDVYRGLILRYTTLPLSPDDVHARGLAAVAEVSGKMAAIRKQLGFAGTASEFRAKILRDPRFLPKSPEDLAAAYMRSIAAIEPKVATYFKSVPKAPYGVQRLPPSAEGGQTFGYYSPPSSIEPRGLYHYNASNLDKLSLINAPSLIYHELIPGHHFHIASQYANSAFSEYRKTYLVGAFNEGWAEYAASLGIELKLYDTPEILYGRYLMELFLASRLVVDTGMNAKGWSLEQARSYMMDLGVMSDAEIDSETLRYSTGIPGQALGYRIGYEEIWNMRHRAERALGVRFDIRDFHEIVLGRGARPFALIQSEIDRYIGEATAPTSATGDP